MTPIEHYLIKTVEIKDYSILKELLNYLVAKEYDPEYSKIAQDEKDNKYPILYLESIDSKAYIYMSKDEKEYYSLVESSFIMDTNNPLIDFEIKKTTNIDEDGFDITINYYKGKDEGYEGNLSYLNGNFNGYITDNNFAYKIITFNQLNTLVNLINDKNLLLTLGMEQLENQLTSYIKSNMINIDNKKRRR